MSVKLLQSAAPPLEDWPELVLLDRPNLPKLNLINIPSFAGNFASALSIATETPPELSGMMVIITSATAAARRLKVMAKPGYFEPCNLWGIVALLPGNRKSAVQTAATEPLTQWQFELSNMMVPEIKRITSERKTMEVRAREIRTRAGKEKDPNKAKILASEAAMLEAELPEIPIQPRLYTTEATPEELGSLLAEQNECMAWLSSEGGMFDLLQGRYSKGIPNMDLVLKAYSGDLDRVDRRSRPSVFLQYPRLSIGLSPQPDVLRGLATKSGFRGRGLLARFLYFLPSSPLGFRTLETLPVPENVLAAYSAGIKAMLNWKPFINENGAEGVHILRLSNEAYLEWHAFAHAIETKMRPGEELEHFTDWAGKAPGFVLRLAGVLHGIQHAHGEPWIIPITAEIMNNALEIIGVCVYHSLAALEMMGADPSIAAAQKVWEWIERRRLPSFTMREAFNALRSVFPRVVNLQDAIELLEERGYVIIIKTPKTTGPGRPSSPTVLVRQDIRERWE